MVKIDWQIGHKQRGKPELGGTNHGREKKIIKGKRRSTENRPRPERHRDEVAAWNVDIGRSEGIKARFCVQNQKRAKKMGGGPYTMEQEISKNERLSGGVAW